MVAGIPDIPNESLQLDDVPLSNADWSEISSFALTYDGYVASGSFDACAKIARDGPKDTLHELRAALFFAQRAAHHTGQEPGGQGLESLQEMVEKIREIVRERHG